MKNIRIIDSIIPVVVSAVFISSIMTGCSGNNESEQSTETTFIVDEKSREISDTTDTSVPEVTTEVVTDEIKEFIEIETPYCLLKYPNKWPGVVRYKSDDTDGVYTVSLYCKLGDGSEHKMIDVYFGDSDVGSRIGGINADGSVVDFCVQTFDMPNEESASREEFERYYEMVDGINDIIESVIASPNYVS